MSNTAGRWETPPLPPALAPAPPNCPPAAAAAPEVVTEAGGIEVDVVAEDDCAVVTGGGIGNRAVVTDKLVPG